MSLDNTNFNEIKKQVLPHFVNIYGEEFIETIIERLNNVVPIFYSSVDIKNDYMIKNETTKKIELTIKLIEKFNINIDDDIKRRATEENNTTKLLEIDGVSNLLKAFFNSNVYKENPYGGIKDIVRTPTSNINEIRNSISTLNNLGINIKEEDYNFWLTTSSCKQVFDKIDEFITYVSSLDNEYKEFDKKFSDTKEMVEKSKKINASIKEKNTLEFLDAIQKFLSEKDKKTIESYKNNEIDMFTFKRTLDIFKVVGDDFYNNGLLDYFSSKANEKLKNQDTSENIKQSILYNRIKYFELINVYDSTNVEEFLNSPLAKKYYPKQEYIDEIISIKEKFAKKNETEFIEITSSYNDNLNTISSLNLQTKSDFNINVINKGVISINPTTKIEDNKEKAIALMFFSKEKCPSKYADIMFIHELNHAIELSLTDKSQVYKSGFETLDDKNLNRPYEILSEVINQEIAMEVTKSMHDSGNFIFDEFEKSKIKGCTTYERMSFLVSDFYNTFKPQIIKARLDNNMESLMTLVGKENFLSLAQIVKEYNDIPYYNMMNDLASKKNTPLTEKRNQLMQLSNETFKNMVLHSQSYIDSIENNSIYM